MERKMMVDTTIYKCPCGSHWGTGDGKLEEWLSFHISHTNGKIREYSYGGSLTPPFERIKDLNEYVNVK